MKTARRISGEPKQRFSLSIATDHHPDDGLSETKSNSIPPAPPLSPNLQKYQAMLNCLRDEIKSMQHEQLKECQKVIKDIRSSSNEIRDIPDTVPSRRKFLIHNNNNNNNNVSAPDEKMIAIDQRISQSIEDLQNTLKGIRPAVPPPPISVETSLPPAPPIVQTNERGSRSRSPGYLRPRRSTSAPPARPSTSMVPWIPQGHNTTRTHNSIPSKHLKQRMKAFDYHSQPSHSQGNPSREYRRKDRTPSFSPRSSANGKPTTVIETIIGGKKKTYRVPSHDSGVIPPPSPPSSPPTNFPAGPIAIAPRAPAGPAIRGNPSSIFMSWPKEVPLVKEKNETELSQLLPRDQSFEGFFDDPPRSRPPKSPRSPHAKGKHSPAVLSPKSPSSSKGLGVGLGLDQEMSASIDSFFADDNNNFDINDQHARAHRSPTAQANKKHPPSRAATFSPSSTMTRSPPLSPSVSQVIAAMNQPASPAVGAVAEDFEQSISSFFNEKDNNFDLDDQHHVTNLPKKQAAASRRQAKTSAGQEKVISRDHLPHEDLDSSVSEFFADESNNFDLDDQHPHHHSPQSRRDVKEKETGLVDFAELEKELERFALPPDEPEELAEEAKEKPRGSSDLLDESDKQELAQWFADLQRRKKERMASHSQAK